MRFQLDQFNRNIPDEVLLADLVAAHKKAAGRPLTFRSYRDLGSYSSSTINERFGSWNNALRKAGITPADEKNVPIEALFDNLRVLWIAKGRQPVFRDMGAPPSQFSASTYCARFGGWRKALEEFVAAGDQDQFTTGCYPDTNSTPATRTPRDPSLRLRFIVLKRDRFCCVVCGRSPATEAGLILEVDHILAWSAGGLTTADNLQTLCFDCNRGKSNS